MVTTFLDPIPIWAMYILTFLVAWLGFELGYRFGLFRQKKVKVSRIEPWMRWWVPRSVCWLSCWHS